MILLLGATEYVGRSFARALRRRKGSFIPLSIGALDYSRFEVLFDYVRKVRPEFVINAAEAPLINSNGGGAAVAERERAEMLELNVVLPQTVARVCEITNTPWAHISSGSIYAGAKVHGNGQVHVECDLSHPAVRNSFARHPEQFQGFTETDEPNFSFRSNDNTFYTGTKALGEEAVRSAPQSYIWRLGLPFNEQDDRGNFLSQLQDSRSIRYGVNSVSQVDECTAACLELWERRAAYGVYNVANPGALSTHEVVQLVQRALRWVRPLECVHSEDGAPEASTPQSDSILDVSKVLRTGVKLRPAREAVERALVRWERNRLSVEG